MFEICHLFKWSFTHLYVVILSCVLLTRHERKQTGLSKPCSHVFKHGSADEFHTLPETWYLRRSFIKHWMTFMCASGATFGWVVLLLLLLIREVLGLVLDRWPAILTHIFCDFSRYLPQDAENLHPAHNNSLPHFCNTH